MDSDREGALHAQADMKPPIQYRSIKLERLERCRGLVKSVQRITDGISEHWGVLIAYDEQTDTFRVGTKSIPSTTVESIQIFDKCAEPIVQLEREFPLILSK